jgi:hypothetical protein
MCASVFLQCSNALTHTLIMGLTPGKSWLEAGAPASFQESGFFLHKINFMGLG